ncbi:Predicted protein [Taphrina deformans PYCC 5710]|uniref:Uncharacterized protein n=1 Tax=Taphrina deformans (strain PYCC 5710 / ATCC 11124 / CBS 356.35 / IMI 108563 / JCM 9778 / NBRC 8474) TaxID=1097556 RepID=R4X7C8_TAPDE|nr:Predicted protein [Taphrina deformans PYCC 5710]|eukprot:CCG81252.1 Predicted protein [Taphrina deformans PYCC 5710]
MDVYLFDSVDGGREIQVGGDEYDGEGLDNQMEIRSGRVVVVVGGEFPDTARGASHPRHVSGAGRAVGAGIDGWSVAQPDLWITRHSRYDKESGRARAEDALKAAGGVVLNLSGLWGGTRQPRHFTKALFPSKQDVAAKRSLHMVHGRDVARAILAVVSDWPGPSRWMLTDGFVYDWWSLLAGWGTESSSDKDDKDDKDDDSEGDVKGEAVKWVWECMNEQGVRALPRSMESLGRCYDSREFWETFKLTPVRARI